MSFFDDFLKKVPAEDQAILNKYPELASSVAKMETDLGQASRYVAEWSNWSQQNWDPQSGMTREEKRLADELAGAQARLAAGVTAGAGANEIAKLRTEFDAKLKASETGYLQAVDGMNFFYRTAAKRILPHQQEFGQNFDPQSLLDFMGKNKIQDPDVAYDKMVADLRAANAAKAATDLDAKHAADIAAAEQRGREKAAQEAAMGPNGVLPTDSTGGIAGVTAHMGTPGKAASPEEDKIRSEAKLGDGSLAQLGYAKYRRGDYSDAVQ